MAMKNIALTTSFAVALGSAALGLSSTAGLATPLLGGTYKCDQHHPKCHAEAVYTVTQDGNKLEFASNKGEQAHGELTSDISISVGAPWNMLGTIHEGTIEWSNGTTWRKHDQAAQVFDNEWDEQTSAVDEE